MTENFIISVSDKEAKRERDKARSLRKTRWWKQRLARGICHFCGNSYSPEELTMDHIIPIIRGGKTTKNNVAVVCKECNNKKKYLLPMEWEEYIRGFASGDEDELG
jgi:5-methylcytosine-specific restriction endonuclease McrA